MAAECQITIFAKAPVAHQVKTRLIPLLGPQGAAEFHARCVRIALRTAVDTALGPVTLCCAPDDSASFFTQCAADFGVTLCRQSTGDLGERMHHALEQGLAQHAAVIIIGSDCPALTPHTLRTAAQRLETHDAVVAPAEDGGYVLIGTRRSDAALFSNIVWSSATVMAQTRDNLHNLGWQWTELATHWDVDHPEDYRRLMASDLAPAFTSNLSSFPIP